MHNLERPQSQSIYNPVGYEQDNGEVDRPADHVQNGQPGWVFIDRNIYQDDRSHSVKTLNMNILVHFFVFYTSQVPCIKLLKSNSTASFSVGYAPSHLQQVAGALHQPCTG